MFTALQGKRVKSITIFLLCDICNYEFIPFITDRSLRDVDSPGVSQDRHRVLSRENLRSLMEERTRDAKENSSRLNGVRDKSSCHSGDSSSSRRDDTMSEASTNISLDTKKKRRRKRKKNRRSIGSTDTTVEDDDEKMIYAEGSNFSSGNIFISPDGGGTNKSGSQGDTDEEEYEDLAGEFVNIMEGGMTLHVITALGTTNPVIVTTDGVTLTWCLKRKPGEKKSILLDRISSVEHGMPPRLQRYFTVEDQERSFCLLLPGGKSASFLAPTSLERDALAQGFDAVIQKNLLSKKSADSGLNVGLDLDAVDVRNGK